MSAGCWVNKIMCWKSLLNFHFNFEVMYSDLNLLPLRSDLHQHSSSFSVRRIHNKVRANLIAHVLDYKSSHSQTRTHSATPVPPDLAASWSQIPAECSGKASWSLKLAVSSMAASRALQVLLWNTSAQTSGNHPKLTLCSQMEMRVWAHSARLQWKKGGTRLLLPWFGRLMKAASCKLHWKMS